MALGQGETGVDPPATAALLQEGQTARREGGTLAALASTLVLQYLPGIDPLGQVWVAVGRWLYGMAGRRWRVLGRNGWTGLDHGQSGREAR